MRRAEEKYRSIVENATEGIFQTSLDGRILMANPALARIFGYESPEELMDTVSDVATQLYKNSEDRAELARLMRERGVASNFEMRILKGRSRDRGVIWCSLNARGLYKDGVLVSYEGMVTDITERKEAEEKLRRSEELTRTVVSNAPVVLFALDRKGVFTLSEGRGLEALGHRPEPVVGRSIFEVYHDEPKILANARRALGGEEFTSITVLAALGRVFEVRWSPVRDGSGTVMGVIGVATNITERKRAEEEIRRLNNVLESRVAERTAQLEATVSKLEANERMLRESEADLQRSRQRLVTAREEERRRLRRDLHDSLGPQLASLLMTAEAVHALVPNDPSRAQQMLEGLAEQAQAAVADVRRLVYALRPLALDALGLIGALRSQVTHYDHSGLRVSIEGPEKLPTLPAAVEVAAYHIILEALNNTARHAEARNCTIRLALEGSTDMLRLEVEDDGRGIEEDRRVGVGLTSMRERAEELGGSCVVEAIPSGGTRVRAYLPYGDKNVRGSTARILELKEA